MKSLITIFTLLMCLALHGCGEINLEDAIAQAEADLNEANIERAISQCDMLQDSTAYSLTATQMCRMAIIYARASEMTDSLDFMASAAKCFERAMSLDCDTDSLNAFIERLAIEDQGVVRELRELTQVLTNPCVYSQETSEDTIDELESSYEHLGID